MSKAKEVLRLYKSLNRTVQSVFRGDQVAQAAAYDKLRQEFGKNLNVENESKVTELIQYGRDCENILKQQVLQFEEIEEKRYRVNIREDMELEDALPFRDDITKEQYRERNRASRKKCSEATKMADKDS